MQLKHGLLNPSSASTKARADKKKQASNFKRKAPTANRLTGLAKIKKYW
jgi:hypothetical protein